MIVNSSLRAKALKIEMLPFEYIKKQGDLERQATQNKNKKVSKQLYQKDVVTLKRFGNRLKLTMCKSMRKKGYEGGERMAKGTANDEKLANNISRAKSKIFEYCMCNEWEYFVTLTIDSKKYDRYDLKKYYKDLGEWLANMNRKLEDKIKYVFIPEMHKDGAWHVHGLMVNIPKDQLFINKNGYMDWKKYADKFGNISLDKIKDKEKCSSYMTKYVSKEMVNTIKELNANTYYCSKGLKVSEQIKKGRLDESLQDLEYDFVNEYVKIKWFDSDVSIADFIEEIKE